MTPLRLLAAALLWAVAIAAETPPTVASVYVVGPGDVLAITVWQEPAISATLPIRPDGKITLPLIGEVAAAGLTPAALERLLSARLAVYIEHPRVTVTVEQVHSRSFNVLGMVAKPGAFDLNKPTTVLDALAQAGGFAEFARESKVFILRPLPQGGQQRIPFNYPAVVRGRQPGANILLAPGDTVVVP